MKLTDKNFIQYAANNYTNVCLGPSEFFEDIGRIKYIKKLLNKCRKKEINERLLLNHLISFYNVFKNDAANKMLFYKCERKSYGALKTYLSYLNYLLEGSYSDIEINEEIQERLGNV